MECALESLLNAPKHSHLGSFVFPSVALSCFGTLCAADYYVTHYFCISPEDSETGKLRSHLSTLCMFDLFVVTGLLGAT